LPADAVAIASVDPAAEGEFVPLSIAELLQLELVLPDGAEAGNAVESTAGDDKQAFDLMELSLLELLDVKAVPAVLPELPDLAPSESTGLLPDDGLDLGPPSHLSPNGGLTPIGVLPGTDTIPPPPPPPPPPVPEINVAPDARNDSYSVSEDGLLVRSAATGVLLNDVDANLDKLQVTLLSGPANGTLNLNPNGSFTYDSNANFSGKDSFTYRVSDGRGGLDTATVLINVLAVNDAPTIVAGSTIATGSVTERTDGAADENIVAHQTTGTIAFADVDVTDTHSATAIPQGSGYLGSLVLGTVDQTGDTVGWTFTASDSALDSLAAGQVRTQTYNIVINDKNGGTATQPVTITIAGTNDDPTITAGSTTATGSVTERADKSAGENSATHVDTGSIAFADVDIIDAHSASVSPQGAGYLGNLLLGSVNQAANSVGWTFSVNDGDLDSLAAGEVATQLYDVAIDDGQGGVATQTVTITLTGTNDAPTIVAASTTAAGSVNERPDGAPDENAVTHQATGSVAFADVDLIDLHGASVVAGGSGYLGVLTLGIVDQLGKTVEWTFSVDDSDLDGLPAGAVATQTYAVTIDDGNGGTITQNITITLNGANDAPSAPTLNSGGSVDENGVNGTVVAVAAASDVDLGDIIGYSLSDDAGGRFSIDANSGEISVADGSLLDFEGSDSHFITVVASDGSLISSTTFKIAVNDVNEVPTDIALSSAAVDENADGAVIGDLTVSDPDAGDSHGFTVSDGRFEVVAGQLRLKAGSSLDFETEPSVSVDVSATDAGGLSRTETFTIAVNDLVESLFTANNDSIDFNSVVDGLYMAGSQYDALAGNDDVTLPTDGAAATAAGYDASFVFSAGDGDDTVTGGGLDDLIAGGAGSDSLSGGAGDDNFEWDSGDATIDGGGGTDGVVTDIGNIDLTTTTVAVTNIERIDLGVGVGANTLTLTAQDVVDATDAAATLTVFGDASDTVDIGAGWTDDGVVGGFHLYSQVVGIGTANLAIDSDINVVT